MTTNDDRSDAALLRASSRDGDEVAFEVLADRHMHMIQGLRLRCWNDRQLVEEGTQKVLLSLARKALKRAARERTLSGRLPTNRQVALFAPVLDGLQRQRHHDFLEESGILRDSGVRLPDPE